MLLKFVSIKQPSIYTGGVHSRTILDGLQTLMSSLLQATGLCTDFVGAMRDLHHVARLRQETFTAYWTCTPALSGRRGFGLTFSLLTLRG